MESRSSVSNSIIVLILFMFILFSSMGRAVASPTGYVVHQINYNGRVNVNSTQTITGLLYRQGSQDPAPNGTWVYILQDNCVLALPMDKVNDGITYDVSGNGNSGTIHNASCVTGKFGNALSFDGVNSSLTIPYQESLSLPNSFTVETWIRYSEKKGVPILTKRAEDISNYNLDAMSDGTLSFWIWDGTKYPTVVTPLTYDDGLWHHVVGIRDIAADKLYIYVDGDLKDSATDTTTQSVTNMAPINIACYHMGKPYFHGEVDEVRIYNRALSPIEIRQHFLSKMSGYTDSNGRFSIGDFYSPEIVGKCQYVVTSENNIGNRTFDIIGDRIVVSSYGNDDERRDVGTEGTVWFKFQSEYDQESVTSGSVVLNGSYSMTWSTSNSRWEYKTTRTSAGYETYYLQHASWDTYGVDLLNPAFSPNLTTTIIWDTVEVTLGVVDSRINVGDNVTITVSAKYLYDGGSFNGAVVLNSTTWTCDTVGRRGYTTQSIIDLAYGLTNFTSNAVYCIWDRINVNWSATPLNPVINRNAIVILNAWREYDGSSLFDQNFTVSRNGSTYEVFYATNTFTDSQTNSGTWTYSLTNITDNTYGLTTFIAPPNLSIQWVSKNKYGFTFTSFLAYSAVATVLCVFIVVVFKLYALKTDLSFELSSLIPLFVIVILGSLPMLWYEPEHLIIRGEPFPHLIFTKRHFFNTDIFVWSTSYGGNLFGLVHLFFLQGIWQMLLQVFEPGIVQLLIETLYLAGSGLTIYAFTKSIFHSKMKALFSSIFYMFNMNRLQCLSLIDYLWLMLWLPLLLLLVQKISLRIRNGKSPYTVIFAAAILFCVTFSVAANNPAFAIPGLIFLLLFITFLIVDAKGYRIKLSKSMFILGGLAAFLSLWWVINLYFNYAAPIPIASPGISPDVRDMLWGQVGLPELLRTGTSNFFMVTGYYPYGPLYYEFPLAIITFIPTILAFSCILVSRKGRKFALFASLILLGLLFIGKGIHEPFPALNLFLYDHFPLMNILRTPADKLSSIIVLLISVLAGATSGEIVERFDSFSGKGLPYRKLKLLLIAAIIMVPLYSGYPLVTGDIIQKEWLDARFSGYVKIPDYWYEAAEWLNSQPGDHPIMISPPNTFYACGYFWGMYAADRVPDYILTKPIIQRIFGYHVVEPYNELYVDLSQALENDEYLIFLESASQFGIKYILHRTDQIDFGDPEKPARIKQSLDSNPYIKHVKTFGALDIYELPDKYIRPSIVFARVSSERKVAIDSRVIATLNFSETEKVQIYAKTIPWYSDVGPLNWTFGDNFGTILPPAEGCSFSIFNGTVHPGTVVLRGIVEGGSYIKFQDSFEKWIEVSGNWSNSAESIEGSASFGTTATAITNLNWPASSFEKGWSGYYLKVDTHLPQELSDEFGAGVTFRFRNNTNFYSVYLDKEGVNFLRLLDGAKTVETVPFTVEGGKKYRLEVLVDWRSFTVVVDNQFVAVFQDDNFWNGQPGLFVQSGSARFSGFQTFDAVASRIDSVSVVRKYADKPPSLEVKRISPVEYQLKVSAEEPFILDFAQSFDTRWKIYDGEVGWLGALINKPLFEENHRPLNEYMNEWVIDRLGDYKLTLYYYPQTSISLGALISAITFSACIFLMMRKRAIRCLRSWRSINTAGKAEH